VAARFLRAMELNRWLPGADDKLAIRKAGADVLTFLRPPFPGCPGLSPARLPSDLHAVMHPQIVEAERQLTLRYVASGPHC
jgi:hypothetical protein